jgi:putative Mn2+ efflux pump MntP
VDKPGSISASSMSTEMANTSSDMAQIAKPHAMRVYILAIVTSMGALMFGYDLAFIGTSIELKPFKK